MWAQTSSPEAISEPPIGGGHPPCPCPGTSSPSNNQQSQFPCHTNPLSPSCSSWGTHRGIRPTRSPGGCSSFRTSSLPSPSQRRSRFLCCCNPGCKHQSRYYRSSRCCQNQ